MEKRKLSERGSGEQEQQVPIKKRTKQFDLDHGASRSMKQKTIDSYVLREPNVSDVGSQQRERKREQQVPIKKRTKRFHPYQSDPHQTTLDHFLKKPDISDAGSQHWEKRTPQRDPASVSSVDQGHIPPESQLTQHSLSSVAETTVAGAFESLGLQRSGPSQGSETFSREIDNPEGKGGELANRLSMLAKEHGVSLEARKRFQEFQRNPDSSLEGLSGLSHEEVLRIAEYFKMEADIIGGMCMDSRVNGKSFILIEFCKECEEARNTYKERIRQSSSRLEDITSALTRYQQAVSSLSKFTIKNMVEAKIEFDRSEAIHHFINTIEKNIINSIDKQDIIERYGNLFQKCKTRCEDFINMINNNSYESVFTLERSINYVKRDVLTLGNILKEDSFQSSANLPLLATIRGHSEAYETAMANCDRAREEQDVARAQKRLHQMIRAVEELGENYSQLAELALKGKGLAMESSATDHMHLSVESDSDVELRQNQEKADHEYAQWLARQEEEQLARDHVESSPHLGSDLKRESTSSEMAMERGSQQDRSLENRQGERSTDSVFLGESDGENHFSDGETLTGMDWRENTDARRRSDEQLYTSGMLKVAQGKLEIYLRDPKYLSAQEIRDVGLKLSEQLDDIRKRCYVLTGQGKQRKGMRSLRLRKTFDEKMDITEKDTKELFNDIKRCQRKTFERFRGVLSRSEKGFKGFVEQVKQSFELDKQEKNIEAYKSEIAAKELGYLFLKERGGVTWGHTTFAVAYMPDRKTGKVHGFLSVNEKVSENAIGKVVGEFRAKYPYERFTLIKRGVREQRHAEEVLLGYAKKHQLEIVGIGASRPFCSSCCELLEKQVDQQALGQPLRGGDGREKSSKNWVGSGPREGDNRRRVNWEIDDKDTYLSDVEEERVYIMENKDSAGWDKNKREKDQIYNIQTKIKFSNKNDKNSILNENLGNNSLHLKLRVGASELDSEAIKKLERIKEKNKKKYKK